MKTKNIIRITLLGLMTWIVPFIAAFFFFDETGQIAVDMYLFKTMMILIGGLTGTFAIIVYFKKIQSGFLNQGIIIGIAWFAINFILDVLILSTHVRDEYWRLCSSNWFTLFNDTHDEYYGWHFIREKINN